MAEAVSELVIRSTVHRTLSVEYREFHIVTFLSLENISSIKDPDPCCVIEYHCYGFLLLDVLFHHYVALMVESISITVPSSYNLVVL